MDVVVFAVVCLVFGCLGLHVLGEIFRKHRETRRRRRLTEEERAQEDRWALGGSFSMRRPHSELRSRHVFKEVPKGRGAELNRVHHDPYAP